jgi:PncC family amidohydrolase
MRTFPSVLPAQSAMQKIITDNEMRAVYNLHNKLLEVNVTISLEVQVGKLLHGRGLKLALAESCTGGLIGHRMTDIAGSSEYFSGGVVAYAYEAKAALLGVSWDTLNSQGAVSRATVLEMAHGVRRRLSTDIAISVSGIAGPGGGTDEKPVGTTWIGLVTGDGEWAKLFHFLGDRSQNKAYAADAALQLLLDYLEGGLENEAA